MKKLIIILNRKVALTVVLILTYGFVNAQINCPNNNGLIITTTGTLSNGGYFPMQNNNCTPNAQFNGAAIWTGNEPVNPAGTIIYTFSQPINCATVAYTSVDNQPINNDVDVAAITVDNNPITAITIGNLCGVANIGNIVTSNLAVSPGHVSFSVRAINPFTTITLTNVGGASGWSQGNPCSFTWSDGCGGNAPILSQTTLVNLCPETMVDLSSINVLNQSGCNQLTWHSGLPANNANILASTIVGAGSYFASFFDPALQCYSQTTRVIVTVGQCPPTCPPSLTLGPMNNVPTGQADQEAGITIFASNVIGNGAQAVYHAGNLIELNPGFEAINGARFAAYIDICNNIFNYKSEVPIKDEEVPIIKPKSGFRIIPNPSSHSINIEMQQEKITFISIAAFDGRTMLEKSVRKESSIQIDVSDFQNGIYFVNVVTNEGKVYTQKLIKK